LAASAKVPRWATLPGTSGDGWLVRDHPEDYLDCGLAHDAPGALVLLAMALPDELLRLPAGLAWARCWMTSKFFARSGPTSI